MSNTINVRSPKIVTVTGVANDDIKVEIYLWNSPASQPLTPTFTLEKPIPSSVITQCSFDISPYCRGFIEHVNYVEVTADTAANVNEYAYCHVKLFKNGSPLFAVPDFICFDGFGYYSEGANPEFTGFITDGSYYVNSVGNSGGVYYYDDQTVTWTARYTDLAAGGAVTTITLANEVGYIPYVHSSYLTTGNKLEIIKDGVVKNTCYFYVQSECKYQTINCDFVNKFGAWQRLVFFKASKESFDMTNTEYNLMPENIDYNVKKNVRQVFNVNGAEKISVNTGWVFESYSEVMKQLMLSEKILLDDKPVIIETKSLELQKNINDRNINYNLSFKYANPTLNYNI
jgi:hypothetical protein